MRAPRRGSGKENVQKYYEEESQKALKPAVERLAAKGLRRRPSTLVGDPAEEIAKYATGQRPGPDRDGRTHGRTGLANLVLGSVATKVLATNESAGAVAALTRAG